MYRRVRTHGDGALEGVAGRIGPDTDHRHLAAVLFFEPQRFFKRVGVVAVHDWRHSRRRHDFPSRLVHSEVAGRNVGVGHLLDRNDDVERHGSSLLLTLPLAAAPPDRRCSSR